MLLRWRARLGYLLARRLLAWTWLVRQPRAWDWMQGQFARLAAMDDVPAQSFYGHLLLFRGQGLAARAEGVRLLRLAAAGGNAKAAYQLGAISLAGDARQPPDGVQAAHWWRRAAEGDHPLAARRLAELYRRGGHGLMADPEQAERYAVRAAELGL